MSSAAAGYDPPRAPLRLAACRRIIPSRFPPVNLFERVANPADLDVAFALESLTNDRITGQGKKRWVRTV
jgi:hypothetical protein